MVDVVVAVDIAEMGAASLFYKDRIGVVSAIVAGDAQRETLEVLFMGFGGFRRAALESFELLLEFGVHRESPMMLRP